MADVNVWSKKNITYNSLLPHYPITSFLRLVFTETNKYSDNLKKINSQTRVLDIGTYYLNNLLPFNDRKCKLYGTESTDDAIIFLIFVYQLVHFTMKRTLKILIKH